MSLLTSTSAMVAEQRSQLRKLTALRSGSWFSTSVTGPASPPRPVARGSVRVHRRPDGLKAAAQGCSGRRLFDQYPVGPGDRVRLFLYQPGAAERGARPRSASRPDDRGRRRRGCVVGARQRFARHPRPARSQSGAAAGARRPRQTSGSSTIRTAASSALAPAPSIPASST